MDKDHSGEDRVEGALKQAKGSIKEAIGKVTGNTRAQVEGKAEAAAAAGEAQSPLGEARDAPRSTSNR